MKLPKNDSKVYQIVPAGNHLAVCFSVVDLGTQEIEYQGEIKRQHKIRISWELVDELMEDGRPFVVSQKYTLSSFEKATLMQHLNSWRGRPLDGGGRR